MLKRSLTTRLIQIKAQILTKEFILKHIRFIRYASLYCKIYEHSQYIPMMQNFLYTILHITYRIILTRIKLPFFTIKQC